MERVDDRLPQALTSDRSETITDRGFKPKEKDRRFVLRFAERRLLLIIVDLLVVNVALFASLRLRNDTDPAVVTLGRYLLWTSVWSSVWLLTGFLLEIYDHSNAARRYYSSWLVGGSAILASLVYELIPWITPGFPERRLYVILFPLLVATGSMVWRHVYATVFSQMAFQEKVLVVGAGWSGQAFAEAMRAKSTGADGQSERGVGYSILGFVDDDPAKQGKEVCGIPVLGSRVDLVSLSSSLAPDKIILAITDSQLIHSELFQALLDCQEMGISFSTMASVYERLTGRVPVEHAGKDLSVVLPTVRPATHRLYLVVRRLFDILVALIGCLYLLVLMPVVWLANRLGDGGDLFYYQDRVGKGGQVYSLFKFRSMVMDAEEKTGAIWAREDDERITPVGHFLRKTRLDEVPQFWNVLKGEMSLIGPRPERPEFVQQLAEEIPFYRIRHSVRPGITGWAQVNYPYGASVQDALMKLQYDLYYIKRQGLYLDLKILLKTVQVTLGFKGR